MKIRDYMEEIAMKTAMKPCFYLIVNKDNKVVAITRNKGKAEFYRKSYNLLENSKHSIIIKYSK